MLRLLASILATQSSFAATAINSRRDQYNNYRSSMLCCCYRLQRKEHSCQVPEVEGFELTCPHRAQFCITHFTSKASHPISPLKEAENQLVKTEGNITDATRN